MSIYKYFKQKETPLPNPNGSLVEIVPSKSIAMANREVKHLLEEAGTSGTNKRGSYQTFTGEEKAKIAKRANEWVLRAPSSTLRKMSLSVVP